MAENRWYTKVLAGMSSRGAPTKGCGLDKSSNLAGNGPIHRMWATEAITRRDDVRSGRVQTIPGEFALAEVRKALGG